MYSKEAIEFILYSTVRTILKNHTTYIIKIKKKMFKNTLKTHKLPARSILKASTIKKSDFSE